MEIGAILLLLALLVPVALYLVQPFGRPGTFDVRGEEHELSALLAERERIIAALQELDFDYALGKIAGDDYPSQRAALLQQGADVLRRLDALTAPSAREGAPTVEEMKERLEAAVAARHARAAAQSDDLADEDLEALIAARRRARQERSAGFCPHCGKAILDSDRFCPSCGEDLTQ